MDLKLNFGRIDRNDNGRISLDEFARALRDGLGKSVSEDEFDELKSKFGSALKGVDFDDLANDDGKLSTRDLARRLFKELDKNDSGRLGRSEWNKGRKPVDDDETGSDAAGSGESKKSDDAGSASDGAASPDLEDVAFKDLDTNGNGRIGAREAANALLKKFDDGAGKGKKGDNKLSGRELDKLADLLGVSRNELTGGDGVASRSDLTKFFQKQFDNGDFGKTLDRNEFRTWKKDRLDGI